MILHCKNIFQGVEMRVFLILFFVFLINNVYVLTVLEDENK